MISDKTEPLYPSIYALILSLIMTPVSSTGASFVDDSTTATGLLDSTDVFTEHLVCPICDEDMISLTQLNRHIDDEHTERTESKGSKKRTPQKKTIKLDLFDNSNGFGLRDSIGDTTEGVSGAGQQHKLTRSHWKQPLIGKPNHCSDESCKKLLNVKNGIVNCRKCGLLYCNDHTRYKVRLSDSSEKGGVPQYDSFGIFARCCEKCYYNKALIRLGTQVNSRDLTEDVFQKRKECIAEKQSKKDILQKRFIKLAHLMSENYLWHIENKTSLFLMISAPRPPYTKEEYLEKEKEIVGYENWQIDSQITHCPLCFVQFNFLIRKHHCRLCGTIVSDLAMNSDDPSAFCSLVVPASIFMKMLPTLNYLPLVLNNWNSLILLDPESSRYASLFSFRCCKACKNTIIPKGHGEDTNEADTIFATYNELLILKQNISHSMPRYEAMVLENLDRQNEQTNRLRAKLMKYLKDFETVTASFRRRAFRLDPQTKKHVPVTNPTLVSNMYKLMINFLQDSLLQFKRTNDSFLNLERERLSGQLGGISVSSNTVTSPVSSSASPVDQKPRLTKKQIRELREELMVVSEQKFLVELQIDDAKKGRRFDEIPALSDNISELEKRRLELEKELGEFGFD